MSHLRPAINIKTVNAKSRFTKQIAREIKRESVGREENQTNAPERKNTKEEKGKHITVILRRARPPDLPVIMVIFHSLFSSLLFLFCNVIIYFDLRFPVVVSIVIFLDLFLFLII